MRANTTMDTSEETGTNWFRVPTWLRTVLIGRNPRRTFLRIAVLVAVVAVLRMYVILPICVEEGSMLPTFRDGSINFVNCLAYLWSKPKRGDIVAIRLAGRSVMYVKRIVALPGESIEFHQGHVFINGAELDEPYLKLNCQCWDIPPLRLAPNWFYVVGDNRSMPEFLHTKGKVPRERIVGKVLLCNGWFDSSYLRL
jgi:signal peptidase I